MKPQKQVKTGPMAQTPYCREQEQAAAKEQAQCNKYRPKFTQGGAAKGK